MEFGNEERNEKKSPKMIVGFFSVWDENLVKKMKKFPKKKEKLFHAEFRILKDYYANF